MALLSLGLLILAIESPSASAQVPLYSNLGNLHHKITTRKARAQLYFDQGLRLMYAFNPEEARRAFQEAARLDGRCAMCFWGIALSYGPNLNTPMAAAAAGPAHEAIRRALALAPGATPAEGGYIGALSTRYPTTPPANRARIDSTYATAMRRVARKYPDDPDAAVLYAEAMLDLRPWDQWTPDGRPQPGTQEVIETLEAVLKRFPHHPGACHFYIHAVEASPAPERALPCAARLPGLMPGAGHLAHLPAQVYIRLGRYAEAAAANEHAAHADEKYIADRHPGGLYPQFYYPHHLHFLLYASMMQGNSAAAMAAARKLAAAIPPTVAESLPALQYFLPLSALTLVRFGRWKEALAQPAPPPELHYAVALGHYARGIAQAATGDLAGAGASLDSLTGERLGTSGAGGAEAERLRRIAGAELAGIIAGKRGSWEEAGARLGEAVAEEDSLPYNEPPWAYAPARQLLGAALLHGGRGDEAEAVYREDLSRHPHNGWSLAGLTAALRLQGKPADSVEAEFGRAWARADVRLDWPLFEALFHSGGGEN
jgi:tetratricopeptide (TPR) repeat protein